MNAAVMKHSSCMPVMDGDTFNDVAAMKSTVLAFVFAIPAAIPSLARAQHHSEPRSSTLDASGVRLVRIASEAGTLKVDGRKGQTTVDIRGVARASSSRILSGIKLIAVREGDVISIKPQMPEGNWLFQLMAMSASLDMSITLPAGIPVEISDGSGDVVVRGVGALHVKDGSGNFTADAITGNVDITDGSGDIDLSNVDGNVSITDGSGDIDVTGVTGSLSIPSDGSGEVYASRIAGGVDVESKGSGELTAEHIGGDLLVRHKGSGSIRYTDVRGRIDIPRGKQGQ